MLRRYLLLALSAICVIGCSAAGPMITTIPNRETRTFIGVVNGLWKYDETENLSRMRKWHSKVDETVIDQLARRYQVRVGIRSGLFGDYSEVVALPDGWAYSAIAVVNDGKTINFGDIVEIENPPDTNLEYLLRIVRKCNAPPGEHERKEWNIGCREIHEFDAHGYGGEHYSPLNVF